MRNLIAKAFFVLLLAACPRGKDSGNAKERVPPVVPTAALFDLPSAEVLREDEPKNYFVGADGTIAIAQPGSYASVLFVTPAGRVSTKLSHLPANVPLQFTGQERGPIQIASFDESVSYVVNPNARPGPWSELEPVDSDELWHTTMWRAAPSQLSAGLLRVVTARNRQWSLVDLHAPGSAQPRWRINLPPGTTCQGITVLPDATHFALIVVDIKREGRSTLQLRRMADGEVVWTTTLESPVSGWLQLNRPMAHTPDGKLLAVVVEDPKHCALCSGISLFDAAKGTLVRKISVPEIVSSDFLHLGLTQHTAWLFELIPYRLNHQFERPRSCQYHSFSIATGKPRPAPAPEWGFDSCKLWGLAAVPNQSGVVGLGWQDSKLLILRATEAP